MGFVEATRTCLAKAFVIHGRASRPEYWWFILAGLIVSVIAAGADAFLFGFGAWNGTLQAAVVLVLGIPQVTAAIRRLHDTGTSGWYLLFPLFGFAAAMGFGVLFGPLLGNTAAIIAGLIMLAGMLIQIYWLIEPSDPGTNRYGPNPHES